MSTHESEPNGRSWVALMAPAIELAKAIANTDFVPNAYRGKPAEIAAAIMYGDEVGLGPLQSLAKISIINGRPTLAAETLRGLILAAGHEIWIEEATNTRVTVGGRRKDSDRSQLFTWSWDDAKRAGIAGKQPWRQYPRPMLLARASAELARAVFADVIGGLAATEELEGSEDATSNAPEPAEKTAPSPQGTTRRRRPSRAVIAPSPPAAPADTPEPPPLPDEETEPKASEPQLRKMFALFNQRGLTERDDRLDWTNRHLDRTIISSSELTDAEASWLIDILQAEEERAPAGIPGPPAAPAQAELDEPLVTRDRAQILRYMAREAGLDDSWLRGTLETIGAKAPEKINEATLAATLTRSQGEQLQSLINAALDARPDEGDE